VGAVFHLHHRVLPAPQPGARSSRHRGGVCCRAGEPDLRIQVDHLSAGFILLRVLWLALASYVSVVVAWFNPDLFLGLGIGIGP
jgi:hypothetical protein